MEKIFVFTYRYMWQIKGNKSINFKIVTDTEDGLKYFEDALKKVENVERISREYISQIDVSKMGLFESIYKSNSVNLSVDPDYLKDGDKL